MTRGLIALTQQKSPDRVVLKKENEKIVLVTRTTHGKSKPVGIVTMKDLVEELLGELTEW